MYFVKWYEGFTSEFSLQNLFSLYTMTQLSEKSRSIFNLILTSIALLSIIYIAYAWKDVHWAIYTILWWLVFQFSKDDVLKALEILKKWKE